MHQNDLALQREVNLIKSNACVFFSIVYEAGSVFSPDVLDITEEDILKTFLQVCA